MKPFHRSRTPQHVVRSPGHSWSRVRTHVTAAFRACGIDVDPVAAQQRSSGFYRSSAMAWARSLG